MSERSRKRKDDSYFVFAIGLVTGGFCWELIRIGLGL